VASERVARRQPVVQQAEQLDELLDEVVGSRLPAVALQRQHRHRVGARRPAQPEVDALGVQPAQGAERLDDLERAVVRKHHSPAAHADPLSAWRDRPDQDLRCRAGERRRGVVLGDPVAVVAERVGQLGQVHRMVQRLGGRGALGDRGLVEDAQQHG
jgi:hypothetical protein